MSRSSTAPSPRPPRRSRKGFSIIAHTADTGVQAYGKDLPELFANAARGLFHVIADVERVAERESREVSVNARDAESLLVAWLNEFVYLFDVDNMLFHRFEVLAMTDTSISALAHGERVDPRHHKIKTGVKSATFHGLHVTHGPEGYTARVILDI